MRRQQTSVALGATRKVGGLTSFSRDPDLDSASYDCPMTMRESGIQKKVEISSLDCDELVCCHYCITRVTGSSSIASNYKFQIYKIMVF